ncbi:hypothetical protein VP1G_03404 [Cytospora mali]|uniref:Uncharacterized protein n=1 Tax=Cytospora mali TaxID=578113 RepID=A0A194UWI1_CYTMA|nr:hypothetical protein VP1G_03404 [Valsa mali var. pyri (nom. inval.)]
MASSHVAFLTDIPGLIHDEVQSIRAACAAEFSAPKVISYGTHPETPYVPASILITRLPGVELANVCKDGLEHGECEAITEELRIRLNAICPWAPPAGPSSIRSITGEPTRSIRVLDHRMSPFDDKKEFTRFLLAPASPHSYNPKRGPSTT